MPFRWCTAVLFLCLIRCAVASPVEQVAPRKWLGDYLPEKLPNLEYPKYDQPIDRAELEVFTGRYKKSLLTLATIGDAASVRSSVVRAKAFAALGRFDEAIAAVSAGAAANDANALLQRSTILTDSGKPRDAINALQLLIERQPRMIAAHYELARALEAVGDLKAALAQYTWFMDGDDAPFARWQREQERAYESAADVVCIGRAADRWAQLTSAYKSHPELNDAIFNIFVRDYDVVDRQYWPAHIAAAEYFLSHDNSTKAAEELDAAAKINPVDAREIELRGKIAIASFNFDGCDKAIEILRSIDSTSFAAQLLETRNLMLQRRPAEAQAAIQIAIRAQPHNFEALGLLAATYALQLDEPAMNAALKVVDDLDVDHDDATARFEIAEQLGAMRQYPRAILQYKAAIDRAPWWTEALNGLGLLYTQSGDEENAQLTLNDAHDVDPYNLRTTNYLRLLEDLAKFTRKETDHFIVMYDGKADPVIPEYFGEYLESIHDEVSREYSATPPRKTMIEVFPTHDAFSVRTTGSPWIGTVGASTGRVIALVSPRTGENTMGAFNWAQVLRHEYTHTVTLAATDNRIAHWFTEGLAVYQEHSPLRWEWIPMLYGAVTKDQLFTLDNLTWGFIRPRRPIDRQLAYAQSFWICEYIEEKYGHDSILKMLTSMHNGKTQEQAFSDALGKTQDEFSSEFFAWTKAQVAGWGYDADSTKKYEALRKTGEALIAAKKHADAVAIWQQIVALRPVDALPHQRLAGLYLTKEVNDKAKAVDELKRLQSVEIKDDRYAKRIATILLSMNNLDEAAAMAMQAVYTDPYDAAAHELLAKISDKSGDAERGARETRVLEMLRNRKPPADESDKSN